MKNNVLNNEIIKEFKGKGPFKRNELLEVYRRNEPGIKEGTFGSRIFELKGKGIIRNVAKGVYEISSRRSFHPQNDKKLRKIYRRVSTTFNELELSIWKTKWLNDLSIHQLAKSLIIFEVESNLIESVFFFIKDKLDKNVFLNPSKDFIDLYILGLTTEPIILVNLITKSPLQLSDGIKIPKLEKILVDVYSSETLFPAFQGTELIEIFNSAYRKYELNFSTLFNYSRRRGKEEKLREFLIGHTEIPQKIIG